MNLLSMSAAENVSLGFLFFPCQVRRMLYCVTVFVVVKTKNKKTKMDISSQLGCPRFLFSLKCLVKPHRIGFVTPLQRCCSAFSTVSATTCYQLPALVLGKSSFIFLSILFLPHTFNLKIQTLSKLRNVVQSWHNLCP